MLSLMKVNSKMRDSEGTVQLVQIISCVKPSVFLPPYCPELNPIERLWQDIKAKLFSPTHQTLKQM